MSKRKKKNADTDWSTGWNWDFPPLDWSTGTDGAEGKSNEVKQEPKQGKTGETKRKPTGSRDKPVLPLG